MLYGQNHLNKHPTQVSKDVRVSAPISVLRAHRCQIKIAGAFIYAGLIIIIVPSIQLMGKEDRTSGLVLVW